MFLTNNCDSTYIYLSFEDQTGLGDRVWGSLSSTFAPLKILSAYPTSYKVDIIKRFNYDYWIIKREHWHKQPKFACNLSITDDLIFWGFRNYLG